jgi:GNAT superfamily N-acetyltransferase
MAEIRPVEEDIQQITEFVGEMWRLWYTGHIPVPDWSADFLARELRTDDDTFRRYTIGAYDGTRLIGLLPGWPIRVLLHGEELPGVMGSFACVHPDYQRQGVADVMRDRAFQQAADRGDAISLLYLYARSKKFRGTGFWCRQSVPTQIIRKLGLWVNPLDCAAVSQWELLRFESWATRLLAPFRRRLAQPRQADSIRPYRPEDLPACDQLIRQRSDSLDLAQRFDADALRRQLEYKDVANTLLIEHEGRVAGLVNFNYLDILGRSLQRFGVIDLLAFEPTLPHRQRTDLLRAVLSQMKQDGVIAALMLRGSRYAWWALRSTGFLPMFPEYNLLGVMHSPDVSLDNIRQLFLLWR